MAEIQHFFCCCDNVPPNKLPAVKPSKYLENKRSLTALGARSAFFLSCVNHTRGVKSEKKTRNFSVSLSESPPRLHAVRRSSQSDRALSAHVTPHLRARRDAQPMPESLVPSHLIHGVGTVLCSFGIVNQEREIRFVVLVV